MELAVNYETGEIHQHGLTDDNYFSLENENKYMGVSQFKAFMPSHGGCEAKKMAELKGLWKDESSTALLVGSYFHAHFEGALGKFKQEHPEIFTKQGILKSEYKKADEMINCLESDESFKQIYQGEKENIFTFELFGTPWKIKVDCLNSESGYFVDLKSTRDFEKQWSEEERRMVTFVEAWGYLIQMGVYREGIKKNLSRDDIEGFIIAATKQDPPDKIVLRFNEEDYLKGLKEVEFYLPHILDVKNGVVPPQRCEKCNYCRATKKLDRAIHYTEL
jgi:hypothetical protein